MVGRGTLLEPEGWQEMVEPMVWRAEGKSWAQRDEVELQGHKSQDAAKSPSKTVDGAGWETVDHASGARGLRMFSGSRGWGEAREPDVTTLRVGTRVGGNPPPKNQENCQWGGGSLRPKGNQEMFRAVSLICQAKKLWVWSWYMPSRMVRLRDRREIKNFNLMI